MDPIKHEGKEFEAVNIAVAPGMAALHGLKQLIKELEPTIGAEGSERVRAAIETSITSSSFPKNIEAALLFGLR